MGGERDVMLVAVVLLCIGLLGAGMMIGAAFGVIDASDADG